MKRLLQKLKKLFGIKKKVVVKIQQQSFQIEMNALNNRYLKLTFLKINNVHEIYNLLYDGKQFELIFKEK